MGSRARNHVRCGSVTGGLLGERLLVSGLVHAQKSNGVNAEEFLLLDQSGKARAGLGLDSNGEVGWVPTNRPGIEPWLYRRMGRWL